MKIAYFKILGQKNDPIQTCFYGAKVDDNWTTKSNKGISLLTMISTSNNFSTYSLGIQGLINKRY